MALIWGIASSGKIANDFVTALKALPKCEHYVEAVAARNLSSAESFAHTHNIPTFYEGYEKLAKNEKVQVVYIGVLNPQHLEVAILMLEHGKHVLCEKPLSLNEKQTRKIIDLAKTKNLFLMEAIWSRCFPVYKEVKELLESNTIGEVKFVSVNFGFDLTDIERLNRKSHGGGVILDLGVYVLQFQQFVYKGAHADNIVVGAHLNEDGVDNTASAIFIYPNGKTAIVTCNGTIELANEAIIVGTKGTIKIPNFWSPTTYELNGQIKEFPLIENDGTFNFRNSAGLAYEAIEVREQILKGNLESNKVPHRDSIQIAQWMDLMRKNIGVVYPQDLE